MTDAQDLVVSFPKFDESVYRAANEDARASIELGLAESGFDHFLRRGIDENRHPYGRREPAALAGAVERCLVSDSGYFLYQGWLSDEGREGLRAKIFGVDFTIEVPHDAVLRHARRDVELQIREGAFDFGFVVFGRCPAKSLLKQPVLLQFGGESGLFQGRVVPDIVADRRLLDTLLCIVASCQSHAGREANLHAFLAGSAGSSTVALFRAHVAAGRAGHHVCRYRARPVARSFVTVLFGSTEAIMLQPVLFLQHGIDFGEWIYVCNSSEDAEAALRLGRVIADLYDVMITIIVMGDNVGFGEANNVAISQAAGTAIYIVNPDVYPVPAYTDLLRSTLERADLGETLWGGLLFYDEATLMHSGMYVDRDTYVRGNALNAAPRSGPGGPVSLLRVEHFDKGVPFDAARWTRPKRVPAITGAVMAFRRAGFEALGGFSTRYVYGHYEDADLSLRWAREIGPVMIDPHLRLVHLEGQGSRARGDQYRGAAMVNRYFFSAQHLSSLDQNIEEFPKLRAVTAAARRHDDPG